MADTCAQVSAHQPANTPAAVRPPTRSVTPMVTLAIVPPSRFVGVAGWGSGLGSGRSQANGAPPRGSQAGGLVRGVGESNVTSLGSAGGASVLVMLAVGFAVV